jgi:hypothetical protein
MCGSLEDPLAKLGRAVTHFHALRALHGGGDRKRYAVTAERSSTGLEFGFRIGAIEPLDPSWPLLVGDAYHNLRTALDQLVYQLHVRQFKGSLPAGIERDSQFPVIIERKSSSSSATASRGICRLNQRDKRDIEILQPYLGMGKSYPPKRSRWVLRRTIHDVHLVDIIDKHRHIQPTVCVVQAVGQPQLDSSYGFKGEPCFDKELKSGDIVDIWRFDKEPPSDVIDSYEHRGVLTAVAIMVETRRIEVIPHLGGSIHAIGCVINRFADRFPDHMVNIDLSEVHHIDDVD